MVEKTGRLRTVHTRTFASNSRGRFHFLEDLQGAESNFEPEGSHNVAHRITTSTRGSLPPHYRCTSRRGPQGARITSHPRKASSPHGHSVGVRLMTPRRLGVRPCTDRPPVIVFSNRRGSQRRYGMNACTPGFLLSALLSLGCQVFFTVRFDGHSP